MCVCVSVCLMSAFASLQQTEGMYAPAPIMYGIANVLYILDTPYFVCINTRNVHRGYVGVNKRGLHANRVGAASSRRRSGSLGLQRGR